MKPKVLITTLPTNDLGLLARSLPVALELSRRGYEVVFSHPARAPIKLIREAGFENIIPRHPLYEIGFSERTLKALFSAVAFNNEYGGLFNFCRALLRSLPLKKEKSTSDVWDTDHALAITGGLNYCFVKAQCEAYLRVIEKSGAEVIVDFWNPFACIAARKLGKTLITINQADALPQGQGFIWWKPKPPGLRSVVPTFNRLLKEYRLRAIKKLEDLNVGDLTLVVGMPETDPLEWSHQFTYVGPLVWEKPDETVTHWLSDLPSDKPVIWLYGGNPMYGGRSSIFNSIKMLKACVNALANEDLHVVLALGHHQLPNELKPLPPNFQLLDFAPAIKLAERCDLMIHHGGYGSCQTALLAGTPALIIPTFSERESNARRIAAIGAGVFIPPSSLKGHKHYDSGAIKNAVKEVLAQPAFELKAKLYSEKLKQMGGAAFAADLMEKFLRNSSP